MKNKTLKLPLILAACALAGCGSVNSDQTINTAPSTNSSAVLTATTDSVYRYTFSASDVEDDAIIAYDGYSGAYPQMTLVYDERFDTFNSERWIKSTHTFLEPGCVFEERGVQFVEGIMRLIIDKSDNDKNYFCGELRSVDKYSYGRIEARIKTPATEVASGYISSLFTYTFRPDGETDDDPSAPIRWRELDIEMEGGRPNKFQANMIFGDNEWEWWKTGYWGRYEDKIVIGPTSEWKVYALEWTPSHLQWFVDGELVKTLLPADMLAGTHGDLHNKDANIPEYPMGLYMNFWIPNDTIQDVFGGNKSRNVYPMFTEYDWFRYYSWNE